MQIKIGIVGASFGAEFIPLFRAHPNVRAVCIAVGAMAMAYWLIRRLKAMLSGRQRPPSTPTLMAPKGPPPLWQPGSSTKRSTEGSMGSASAVLVDSKTASALAPRAAMIRASFTVMLTPTGPRLSGGHPSRQGRRWLGGLAE